MDKWPIYSIDGRDCFPVYTWWFAGGTQFTWWAQTDKDTGITNGLTTGFLKRGPVSNSQRCPARFFDKRYLQDRVWQREQDQFENQGESIYAARKTRYLERIIKRLETIFLRDILTAFDRKDYNPLAPELPLIPLQYSKKLAESADWLFKFYVQTSVTGLSTREVSDFRYRGDFTLNPQHFGETLHIFACETLIGIYKPPQADNIPDFQWGFLDDKSLAAGRCKKLLGERIRSSGQRAKKGEMNRFLLVPMLVQDPIAKHAKILHRLLSSHQDAIDDIVDTAAEFTTESALNHGKRVRGGRQKPSESVGIWIRHSSGNPTTNMDDTRFQEIVAAIPPHHGIMLLGDEAPWIEGACVSIKGRILAKLTGLSGPSSAPSSPHEQGKASPEVQSRDKRREALLQMLRKARNGNDRKEALVQALLAAQDGDERKELLRQALLVVQDGDDKSQMFYQTQASILVSLYRHHGLYCVVGNKSGGMDLAAFAAIPSIQISPEDVEDPSRLTYERMFFTSLCSPFWRMIYAKKGTSVPSERLKAAISAAEATKVKTKDAIIEQSRSW